MMPEAIPFGALTEVTHEWSTPPGDHSLAYWSAHVEDYLRFYANVLCRDARVCPAPR